MDLESHYRTSEIQMPGKRCRRMPGWIIASELASRFMRHAFTLIAPVEYNEVEYMCVNRML